MSDARPAPATDPVDSTNVAEFFTRENEGDETKSVDWFQRMTGNEKPEPPPKFDESETQAEQPVVDSEQETDPETAPAGEGDPVEAGEPEDPAGDEGEDPQTSDDLQSVVRAERERAESLARQLAQVQWTLSQQAAQAQEAATEPEPPVVDAAYLESLQDQAYRTGQDLQLLVAQATAQRVQWEARQVLAEHTRAQREAAQVARRERFEAATDRVVQHASRYEEHSAHVLSQLHSYPELFEVTRNLEPSAMERVLTRFMDGMAAEAKLAKLEAREGAVVDASRRAGREEAQNGKVAKVQSTRTQAARPKSVTPNLSATPEKTGDDTKSYIRQLASSRASSTWE